MARTAPSLPRAPSPWSRFLVLLLPLLGTLSAQAAPSLVIGESAVTVDGVAPGGQVVVLAVMRHHLLESVTRVTRVQEVLLDDDGDGTASLDLDVEIPLSSLWIAVDLVTGGLVVEAPEGFPVRSAEIDPRRLHEALGRIELDSEDALVLAVRPGVGAWALEAGDGGLDDEDATSNGLLVLAKDRLVPLADAPPPPLEGFVAGDVIAALDVRRMAVMTARVAQ